MNYIDISRNIAAGKGIVQNSLGFNRTITISPTDNIPSPSTQQPPLYPLILSTFELVGISGAFAAKIISMILLAAIPGLVILLLKEEGLETGLLVAVCLLFYLPFREIGKYAWTEPLSIFFFLTSILLLKESSGKSKFILLALSGFVCGLSGATRYFFMFSLPFILVLLLFKEKIWTDRLKACIFFTFGWFVAEVPVLVRNFAIDGQLLPGLLPSSSPLLANLQDLGKAAFEQSIVYIPSTLSNYLAIGLIAILVVIVLTRTKRESQDNNQSPNLTLWILGLWSTSYLVLLVYQRTQTHFDNINLRLTAPALILLFVIILVFLIRAVVPSQRAKQLAAVFLLLLGCGLEINTLISIPPYHQLDGLMGSPRYRLAKKLTGKNNLIIGHNTIDITFLLQKPTISFSYYPSTPMPSYSEIKDWANTHCGDYGKIYLLLKKSELSDPNYLFRNGLFISDLLEGDISAYPEVILATEYQSDTDHLIYQFLCNSIDR